MDIFSGEWGVTAFWRKIDSGTWWRTGVGRGDRPLEGPVSPHSCRHFKSILHTSLPAIYITVPPACRTAGSAPSACLPTPPCTILHKPAASGTPITLSSFATLLLYYFYSLPSTWR